MEHPTLSVFPCTKNEAFAHSEYTHANKSDFKKYIMSWKWIGTESLN